jgi:hypothetical protein
MSSSQNSIPTDAKMIFKGKLFEVWQWEQKMFDGSVETFEHLKRPNMAVVIPITHGQTCGPLVRG